MTAIILSLTCRLDCTRVRKLLAMLIHRTLLSSLPFRATLLAIGLALLAGCGATSSSSSARFPTSSPKSVYKVEEGTVVSTRVVKVDGRSTVVGQIVGGAVGAVAGASAVPLETTGTITTQPDGTSTIDISDNQIEHVAATVVLATVGAVVGPQVEKALTAKKAQELTIALDSGETVVIVQEYQRPLFEGDERVKLYTLHSGKTTVLRFRDEFGSDPETGAYLPDESMENSEVFEPVTW